MAVTAIRRRILVVGGSRGIGAEIVRGFARDGDEVFFTYGSSEAAALGLASETGATARMADAADRDAMAALIGEAGPFDIFVYNAAVLIYSSAFDVEAADVDRLFDVNVRGAYHGSVEAARSMPDGGRIILIGSTNGDCVPFPGIAAYAMSKASLHGLARALARELGHRNITVNVVQPGPTDTEMNPADAPHAAQLHGAMAIKRHGTAQEIASLVSYLAGPQAGWITGTSQTIDGGFGI